MGRREKKQCCSEGQETKKKILKPNSPARGTGTRSHLHRVGLPVLLGYMLTQSRLRQPHPPTEGAGEGLRLISAVTLTAVEEVWTEREERETGKNFTS